jgi:polar amino acid transport system substrate-binding protein
MPFVLSITRFEQCKKRFIYRFLYIGCLAIFLVGCVSCSNTYAPTVTQVTPTPKPTIILPGNLVTAGFLTVGSYTAYPPQESIDQVSNTAVGFDIDLITAIAHHMNLKIKIVSTDFQNVISNLLAKNFDVAISAIIITPDLQQRINFVPYFIGGESLLVAKGNVLKINGLQDLCGRKVAVGASTLEQKDLEIASDNCEQQKKASIQISVLQSQMAVIQLLLSKRVVASYQDAPVADYFMKQNPGRFEVGGPVINMNLEGIAMRKDDTTMFKALQAAFTVMKNDGTYCTLIKKWGLTSGVLTQNNHRIC